MAVTLDLIQSGSASTTIHAQSGDTLTFLLPATVQNQVMASAVAGLAGLSDITGVTFVASAAGNGSYPLTITQSGSGTTAIDAASGDSIAVELASTVENQVMASAVAFLAAFKSISGVTFTVNSAGGAS